MEPVFNLKEDIRVPVPKMPQDEQMIWSKLEPMRKRQKHTGITRKRYWSILRTDKLMRLQKG